MTQATTRLPAEWEMQTAILLTWPHKHTDWLSQLNAVESVYLNIAKAVLTEQNLIISCEDEQQLTAIRPELQALADQHRTQFTSFIIPADDTWARDHGPISIFKQEHSIFKQEQTVLLDFDFNAWGGKYESSKDNDITEKLFQAGAFPGMSHKKINFILEGGSIESDGIGTLMTSERCLLSSTRNNGLNKPDIELKLKETLGVSRILWLKNGYLAGDDTDAHIDTLARFCDIKTICYVACNDKNDEHYHELQAMKVELEAFKTQENESYRLIPLPMPSAIYDTDEGNTKIRLPATYANFLITNQSILLPIYHVGEDQQAIAQIQRCFPTRRIIPIDCRPLIKEHGSLHCITMQLPSRLPQSSLSQGGV